MEPFLKWPGGKRWLSEELADLISKRLQGRYFEPFLGGGAVFFALRPKQATLADINADLINSYVQVRDNPHDLVRLVKEIPVSKTSYYKVRSSKPRTPLRRAARLLYLNRTAFAGIYRLNQAGEFNVPYGGGDRTPAILWTRSLLQEASEALQDTTILVSDFEAVMNQASEGDVVYCDPTYTVVHESNGFRRYNERNFSWDDQERLARAAKEAYERGALVVVSNANHTSITKLFRPFKHQLLTRISLVSPKPEARRIVHESLFILDPDQ